MNNNEKDVMLKEKGNRNNDRKMRTTIDLRLITKSKLDKNRAPGQCYDGFICQLVDLWERTNGNK